MLDRMMLRSRQMPQDPPPRRRGATATTSRPDYFGLLKSLLSGLPWFQVGLGVSVLALAALVPWGTGQVLSAMDRQIASVQIRGTLVGEDPGALNSRVSQWVGRSFFATDLADVKNTMEQRPWVETAAVKRVWPDRLEIEIREKKPLAYWNDDQLISRSGKLFSPDNLEVAGALPRLMGPDERLAEVVGLARSMADALAARGSAFAGLKLEQRGAWTLVLGNGIEVALGRDQIEERFERFLTVYEGQLAARADEVTRIDARYTNGVAVKWKQSATTPGNNT